MATGGGNGEQGDPNKEDSDTLETVLGVVTMVTGGASLLALGYGGIRKMLGSKEKDGVGINYNSWREPVFELGSDKKLASELKTNQFTDSMNIEEREFGEAATIVDNMLKYVLSKLKKIIEDRPQKYKGLLLERYIYQGSSRDGLKVGAPDEFDALLQFRIEGLQLEPNVWKNENDKFVPEYAELRVTNSWQDLTNTYPWLCGRDIISNANGARLLNSRKLYEKVFQSLIDMVTKFIEDEVNEASNSPFKVSRKVNQPSVNIRLTFDEGCDDEIFKKLAELGLAGKGSTGRIYDIDIVPGILIENEKVPNPDGPSPWQNCPRHCVFKWRTENQKSDLDVDNPAHLWRICTSGYELYFLDVSRRYQKRRLVLTALRILKSYFREAKERSRHTYEADYKIANILRSYHLKLIAFYCILLVCVKKGGRLSTVREAMGYMVGLLRVSLEEQRLPHFFHDNPGVTCIMPNYDVEHQSLSFDLYASVEEDSFRQALRSLRNDLCVHLKVFIDDGIKDEPVFEEFREHIQARRYNINTRRTVSPPPCSHSQYSLVPSHVGSSTYPSASNDDNPDESTQEQYVGNAALLAGGIFCLALVGAAGYAAYEESKNNSKEIKKYNKTYMMLGMGMLMVVVVLLWCCSW